MLIGYKGQRNKLHVGIYIYTVLYNQESVFVQYVEEKRHIDTLLALKSRLLRSEDKVSMEIIHNVHFDFEITIANASHHR